MTRTGDVDTDIHARIGNASAVFRWLRNVWRCSSICVNTKLRLCSSVVLPTAIYAGETWTSVAKTRRMLDVFNRRCLWNILGISWKDHVSNEELFERTKVDNLHDTVDKRRRRFVRHVLRLPSARPVSAAVQWTPEGGKGRRGRSKTWQDTLCNDLQVTDVSWEEAKSVAGDRKEWRSLVAQCSRGTGGPKPK